MRKHLPLNWPETIRELRWAGERQDDGRHSQKRLMMEDKLEGTRDVGGTNQRPLAHTGEG